GVFLSQRQGPAWDRQSLTNEKVIADRHDGSDRGPVCGCVGESRLAFRRCKPALLDHAGIRRRGDTQTPREKESAGGRESSASPASPKICFCSPGEAHGASVCSVGSVIRSVHRFALYSWLQPNHSPGGGGGGCGRSGGGGGGGGAEGR